MSAASPRGGPRVVSLVPSTTETLLAWGVDVVACTRFCEQPSLPTVGGTKDPDLAAVVAAAPDVVVVNDEENRRVDAEALAAAGLAVHSCSPRTVDEVAPALQAMAAAVDADVGPAGLAAVGPARPRRPVVAFVPIWWRPLMTIAGDTYGSSVLAHLGIANLAADAADRYPVVELAEVAARRPTVVLAPTEPYAFRPRHLEALADVAPVVEVDGQDLFWFGVRTPAALERLADAVAHLG